MKRLWIVLGFVSVFLMNGCTGDYYSSDPYSGVTVGVGAGSPVYAPYSSPYPYAYPYPNTIVGSGFYNVPNNYYHNYNNDFNTGHLNGGGAVYGGRRH